MNSFARLTLCSFLCFATLAHADSARDTITKNYAVVDGLFVKKDMKGMEAALRRLSTNDFYSVTRGRKSNLDQLIGNLRASTAPIKKINSSTTKINKFTQKGSTAILDITSTYDFTVPARDGKLHHVNGVSNSTDTWLKVGADWKMKSTVALRDKMYFDGKALPGG